MRHRLYVHLVWTAHDRAPLLDAARARYLASHLPVIARQERAELLRLGIVTTHVHTLIRLHPATGIPHLVQRLKGVTSFGMRALPGLSPPARWASGYTVQSVSERALLDVAQYVSTHATHHPDEAIPEWDNA